MARKSGSTRTDAASITEVPGRVNSQGVDGLSSIPDESGISGAKVEEIQVKGNEQPRGRVPSPSGDGTPQTGSVKGTGKLPIPQSRSNPFKQSDNILQTIADRFVEARKHQKAPAWRQLQIDLMNASPFICPAVIPYKDLIGIVSEIEKEIKGATEQVGKSNEEIIASFLSGEGSLVIVKMDIGPDLERDKTLDNYASIKTDEGEPGTVSDTPLSADDPHSQSPSSILSKLLDNKELANGVDSTNRTQV